MIYKRLPTGRQSSILEFLIPSCGIVKLEMKEISDRLTGDRVAGKIN